MDFNETAALQAYGEQVREWVRANRADAPPLHGLWTDSACIEARRAWQGRLAVPGARRSRRAEHPRPHRAGHARPVHQAPGAHEQKERCIAPMLSGDEVWCQMFSEPAAGSDLAALRTRARRQDHGSFVLDGQKVWRTNAQSRPSAWAWRGRTPTSSSTGA